MTTYKIKIQSSGEEFEIKPSQTILEGAIAAGLRFHMDVKTALVVLAKEK